MNYYHPQNGHVGTESKRREVENQKGASNEAPPLKRYSLMPAFIRPAVSVRALHYISLATPALHLPSEVTL